MTKISKKIDMNMLRDRAERLPSVTEERWNAVSKEHIRLANEFLEMNSSLSPSSLVQYKSGIKQFFWWVHQSLDDKPLVNITKRDFQRYINYLDSRKMSSSSKGFKKSVVSSFCNYIENMVADDEEEYRNFRNFTRGLPPIPKNQVYEKVKISIDEYELIMDVLLNEEKYMEAAWVATAFNAGARRAEIPQFKSELIHYPIPDGQNFILSHVIRLKGSGEDGKREPYMLNMEALKYMRLWIEKRGYDHEYIFTTKYGGEISTVSDSWANNFCANTLSVILNRRINPHLFKASCITYLLEQGVDLALVSKYIAHHNDVSTTIRHYDLRDFTEERNKIFDLK